MQTIDPSTHVSDLVLERVSRARVFERFGIDYCCGGRRSLEEACEEKALDFAIVAAELVSAPEGDAELDGPVPRDLPGLLTHILDRHHAFLRRELPRLSELATKVRNAHGERHPELREISELYAAVRADLEPHLMKEEQILFPWIQRLLAGGNHAGPSVEAPIQVMLMEHEEVGDLLARIRAATGAYAVPADGCPTYHAFFAGLAELEQDVHIHIHEENNLLFPMALELEARG